MTFPTADVTGLQAALRSALDENVAFDAYTRHVYATDASMYAMQPLAVACPRHVDDVVTIVEIASRFDTPVLARGAGTSLGGQTVGAAVVLDFARHMNRILDIDADARITRVQPGVVQDDLNRAVLADGLMFAPDTSTANRATIGGMIGNNSCGARSARYGMTIDHVVALDVVLSDASRARFEAVGAGEIAAHAQAATLEGALYREIPSLITRNADVIRDGISPHWRRNSGYRLERLLPEHGGFDLSRLVVGSEGTLAITTEAVVRLVPRPAHVTALAGHFETVAQALESMPDVIDSGAAVIELVDHMILELARRSPVHSALTAVLEGTPAALLWVEFHAETAADAGTAAARLEARWQQRGAYAVARAFTGAEQARYRALRQAGLGLLNAAATGRERSLAFVEDTAVDPRRLAEYTARFANILDEHRLRAGFYGHASAGCLHIRPFLDLREAGAVDTLRSVAEAVRDLVVEFGGSNSSEHGDGLVRSEFNRALLGDALYEVMCDVKRIFDPRNRFNPGKKVGAPRMTEHLREPSLPVVAPLRTHFRFDSQDGMFGVANRCARIGACRKSAESGGTMCPSYMATLDETHSTRGRANALVLALSSPDPRTALGSERLHEILDLCLECKACRTECPLSVDMASLKSETLAQTWARTGIPLGVRLLGHARELNRAGSLLAPLSNWLATARPLRAIAERVTGIDRRRRLPRFRRDTLQSAFARRHRVRGGRRGRVILLADSFTSYSEPEIGLAAVDLLEQAGWQVELAADVCCGRALISKGLLDEARQRHAALVERLAPAARDGVPIVGVEPSCVITLRDELPALAADVSGAKAIAARAGFVEELLVEAIDDGTLAIDANRRPAGGIVFHAHCHQKAAGRAGATVELLRRLDPRAGILDAGCCGMAGSFGYEREHYDLSMRIGGMRLFPAVRDAGPDAIISATGTSCRQQIEHGTGRSAVHPLVLLRSALMPARGENHR